MRERELGFLPDADGLKGHSGHVGNEATDTAETWAQNVGAKCEQNIASAMECIRQHGQDPTLHPHARIILHALQAFHLDLLHANLHQVCLL